jgi:hypothetical protein
MESTTWATMMLSLLAAGVASQSASPRTIRAWAGVLSGTTAVFCGWANWTGRLPAPAVEGIDPDDVEVQGEVMSQASSRAMYLTTLYCSAVQ